MLRATKILTEDGTFLAWFSERGLARLEFPRTAGGPARKIAATSGASFEKWTRLTEQAVKTVLAGQTPTELPPLDLSGGSDFQKRVWQALRRIAPGQTKTYGSIAAEVGRPKSVRAVGSACGANPIPLLVPCHRVLPKSGGLGGFSSGLAWKKRLLQREGVQSG